MFVLFFFFLSGCSDQDRASKERFRLEEQLEQLQMLLGAEPIGDEMQQGELRVQLVFGSDADLDLYVTDPLLETVYFANAKGKSGGSLSEDFTCEAGELRIEEVSFQAPLMGRYRVGVDFPERCEGKSKGKNTDQAVAYIVRATHNGRREETNGLVQLQKFEVVAMEFGLNDRGIYR